MGDRNYQNTSSHFTEPKVNKVSSLRKQFESFGSFDRMPKPKPPPKPLRTNLLRTQTLRDSALLDHRRGLVVKEVRTILARSLSDERFSSDSSSEIYENVQAVNINHKSLKVPEAVYANSETSQCVDDDYEYVSSAQIFSNRLQSASPLTPSKQSSFLYENIAKLDRTSIDSLPSVKEVCSDSSSLQEDSTEALSSVKSLRDRLKNLRLGPPPPLTKPPPPPKPPRPSLALYDVPFQPKKSSFDAEMSDDSFDSCDEDEPDVEKITEIINAKTRHIIQELLDIEQSYITTLGQGIKDYLWKFDTVLLPDALKGQKRNLFSNIEAIHDFHKSTFYQKLVQCDFDPERIADAFTSSINGYQFDIYIVYVLNRKKSQILCKQNEYFFKQIQRDRLGINSFLLQPIQILPRYRLMVGELVKNLLKDLDNNKAAIAACCVAEKTIQRLLNIVDEHC